MAASKVSLNLPASKVSVKLLVDKSGMNVLFAEAGKDFIDLLYNIMSMPLGIYSSLLTQNSPMVGSLNNLYDSIHTLGETYLRTIGTSSSTAVAKKLYQCSNSFNYTSPRAACTFCQRLTPEELTYVVPPPPALIRATDAGGDSVTYMVTDNLVVSPMSTIATIALLNKLGIKGIDTLEEMVVELGKDEMLKLLKESMQSNTVLTSVFLKN